MNRLKFYSITLMSLFSVLTSCSKDEPTPTPAPVSFTLSLENIKCSAAGGTFNISVDTTAKEWSAGTDDVSIATVSASGTTSSKGSVEVKVLNNPTNAERTVNVYVKSGATRKNIRIVQSAPLTVSPTSVFFKKEGVSGVITVNTTDEWKATTPSAWIKCEQNGNILKITAIANDGDYRTGKVTIATGTESAEVAVTQDSNSEIQSPIPGYHLVWNDEFSEGNALDPKKWVHEVQGAGWVNNELQTYVNGSSPSGRRVTEIKDGRLHINCFSENGKIYSGRIYGNKGKGFTYGVFEARIKLPSGKGTWPAWWMMPVNFKSWPHDGEIDIMEEVGADPNQVSSSIHCTAYNHNKGTQKTHAMYCQGAEGEFHVYTLEWTANYIKTYVDGKPQLVFMNDKKNDDNTWPFYKAFYPILNLAWGGMWGGYKGVDNNALPVTMEVDYVRIYEKN